MAVERVPSFLTVFIGSRDVTTRMFVWLTLLSIIGQSRGDERIFTANPTNIKEFMEQQESGRSLDIGVTGARPYFFFEDGVMKGSDILMIELLCKNLGFKCNLKLVNSLEKAVQMVSETFKTILIFFFITINHSRHIMGH